jgi:alpha-tubulin suppressor-like RCC1 family protein
VPLVTRPTTLLDLHGRSDIVAVRAGKLNSAAVTAAGEALTWGDGKSAKLGHGNDEHVPAPARVRGLEISFLAQQTVLFAADIAFATLNSGACTAGDRSSPPHARAV